MSEVAPCLPEFARFARDPDVAIIGDRECSQRLRHRARGDAIAPADDPLDLHAIAVEVDPVRGLRDLDRGDGVHTLGELFGEPGERGNTGSVGDEQLGVCVCRRLVEAAGRVERHAFPGSRRRRPLARLPVPVDDEVDVEFAACAVVPPDRVRLDVRVVFGFPPGA